MTPKQEQQLNIEQMTADDTLRSTSTHHDFLICKCGEQKDLTVWVNTKVRAVKIEEACTFCGYYKLDPWEIVNG